MKKSAWIAPPKVQPRKKRCHVCKEVKPVHQFYDSGEGYKSSKCKACQLQSRKRPQFKKKPMNYKDHCEKKKKKVGAENWRKYYELT